MLDVRRTLRDQGCKGCASEAEQVMARGLVGVSSLSGDDAGFGYANISPAHHKSYECGEWHRYSCDLSIRVIRDLYRTPAKATPSGRARF